MYQGGVGENRQFWTPDKKYAEQFGKVAEKTGSFYQVENGNRMTDVFVDANNPSLGKGLSSPGVLGGPGAPSGTAEDFAQTVKEKASRVFELQGQELGDISVIGSTARGKLKPNDLDILITRKTPFEPLMSDKLNERVALTKVFESELKSLFPGRKIQVVLSNYDPERGPKLGLTELWNRLYAKK
jgi:predicted nucleotidyltransferase